MFERQTFGPRLPTLQEFIPAIAKAIDQQFGGRQRLVENQRIKYFHKDKVIHKALEDASWELNPVGIKTFYDSILMFEKRAKFISMQENGEVKEKYQSGEKSYETNGKKCNCSSFAQHFLCRYVFLYRQEFQLPVFDAEGMHHALLKHSARREIQDNDPNTEQSMTDEISPPSPGLDKNCH